MRYRTIQFVTIPLMAALLAGCGENAGGKPKSPGSDRLTVVCSFFPIYLFAKNVIGDQPNVDIKLMLPAEMGCPHDYDLKPDDLKTLAGARLFVINGGGLDNFDDKRIAAAAPGIKIVDTSAGIDTDIWQDAGAEAEADKAGHKHDHHHGHDHGKAKPEAKAAIVGPKPKHDQDQDHPKVAGPKPAADKAKHDHDHHHGHDHAKHDAKAHKHDHDDDHGHHHHGDKNPHFFSSPVRAARQVLTIGEALAAADPAGAAKYRANAAAYAKKLETLDAEFRNRAEKFARKKIVTVHEVFDYLADDCGLEVVGTIRSSPEHDPAAGEMRKLIEKIRASGAAAVFTEPQYATKAAEVVAKEAKVPVDVLDPIASGPRDAPLDYYESVQRKNLETLAKTLGEKSP